MSDVHLSPEETLALLDGAVAPSAHLAQCAECRAQLEELRAGLAIYARYYREVLAPLAPPAPAPWKDLGAVMAARDRRRMVRTWRPWAALAAAAALVVLVYSRHQSAPRVEAAQLLEKAIAQAPPPRADARIRVHTGRRDFIRPANRPGNSSERELIALFAAARFDWNAPLTARAFAGWRGELPDRRDEARQDAGLYFIRTSSGGNALSSATLVLRASDLEPVRETLEFRNAETVEISESVDESTPEPPDAVPARPAAPLAGAVPAGSGRLRVLAALDRIGANLGELEVTGEGTNVRVEGTGLGGARQDEIRQALAGIQGVDVRFHAAAGGAVTARPGRATQTALPVPGAPLREMLEAKIPAGESAEDAVNRILDSSDAIMAQAFFVRSLAQSYPPGAEEALSAADRGLLSRLRDEHNRALATRFDELVRLLSPLVSAPPPEPAGPVAWQDSAQQVFAAVQALDSVLSASLAGTPRPSDTPAAVLRQLEDAFGRARSVVR